MYTSAPVIEAALRAQIPYLDVTGEVEVAAAEFEQYADRARDAGIVIVPAMAFFGGLLDKTLFKPARFERENLRVRQCSLRSQAQFVRQCKSSVRPSLQQRACSWAILPALLD